MVSCTVYHPMKPLILLTCIFAIMVALIAAALPKRTVSQTPNTNTPRTSISEETDRLVKNCRNNFKWMTCYIDKFTMLVRRHGFDDSVEILAKVQDIDERTRACHLIAHKIVLSAVGKDAEKWEEILDKVDIHKCGYGFVHGILESRSQFDTSFVLSPSTIHNFCDDIESRKPGFGIYNSCMHIVGHVLLVEKDGNVDAAAETCGELREQGQVACFAGLFMENFTRENLELHGIATRVPWDEELRNTQEKLCKSYSGYAGLGCWIEISYLYNALHPYNPQMLFRDCGRAPTIEYQDACYLHGVKTLLIFREPASNAYMISLCEPYRNTSSYENCTYKVANGLIRTSTKLTDKALHYCNLLEDSRKKNCYANIGNVLKTIVSKEEQKTLCTSTPTMYRDLCEKR